MRLLYCFFILLLAPAVGAQIAAPDFSCTRNEAGAVVLNWMNPPADGCGPYLATEIFRATNLTGPYTLLTSITDPAAVAFSDPNPAGDLRYYFLRYSYDCPGQTVLNSDTLDSFIPVTPIVLFSGVEEDEIVIDWLVSSSPEVTGYIVLEVTPTAFVPLDTVFGATEYRFTFAPGDPDPAGRSFRLVAIDPCGNDSPQGTIVSPVGLTGSGGSGCTSEITLTPDLMDLESFLPTAAFELFVSVNGAPFGTVGTFPPNVATIPYRDANDGDDLCFYVEAVLANNFGRARSTTFCQSVMITQPLRDFPLYGVEVDDAGNVLFQFADDVLQPTPTDAQLLVSRSGGLLESAPLPTPIFGTGGQLTFPPLADPLADGEAFRFRLTDACDREVNTNDVSPVVLEVRELAPGNNQLSWTPLFNGLDGDITYDVFRSEAGGVLTPVVSDLSDLSYLDNFFASSGAEACYKVRARFRPDGAAPTENFVFSSNEACVTPMPELYVPTAFSPNGDGINDEFGPLFSSPPPQEGFHFRIWDRWGSLIHETQDPLDFWDGTNQVQPLPTGPYMYQLLYTVGEGQYRNRAGTVNLLRQD
ncbi:MAG: gliding motility-associated C-terminal domain-containing protein [Lewinella sp.]